MLGRLLGNRKRFLVPMTRSQWFCPVILQWNGLACVHTMEQLVDDQKVIRSKNDGESTASDGS